jgi:hypothetical protein
MPAFRSSEQNWPIKITSMDDSYGLSRAFVSKT